MGNTETYVMTIIFTPPQGNELPKFTYENDPLEVPAGTHEIVIDLVTGADGPVNYAPRAIDWCDDRGFLMVCPQAFSLSCSPTQLLLVDRNLQGCHGEFKFIVYVSYDGYTYASPDPTIINKQPSGALSIGFGRLRAAARVA